MDDVIDKVLADVDAMPEVSHLARVDLANFDTAEILPQRFIIDKLLPRGVVTLLGAHGGAGKSSLALVWAAHIAGGSYWNGTGQGFGRVLFVSLEDGANKVKARLQHIVKACHLDAARIAERLTVLDGSHTDGLLMVEVTLPGGVRELVNTSLMRQVVETAPGHCLVIVDNASDAFGGNENERRQVRRFVRSLGQVAADNDAGMLLLAHIDKMTAKHGGSESYSGSTAWHNSVRSRLALIVDDQRRIVLNHQKHNFSAQADDIEMHWQDAVLVPGAPDRSGERDAESLVMQKNVKAVVAGMRRIIVDGLDIPTTNSSAHNCWSVLASDPDLKALGKAAVKAAVVVAERRHLIERENYRKPDRKTGERWRIAAFDAAMEG